jgi:hypothetical protein
MCSRHFAWIKEEEEEERSNFLRLNEPSIAVTTSWSSLSAQLIKWDQLCLAQAIWGLHLWSFWLLDRMIMLIKQSELRSLAQMYRSF